MSRPKDLKVFVLPRKDGKWEVRSMTEGMYAKWKRYWADDAIKVNFSTWLNRKRRASVRAK